MIEEHAIPKNRIKRGLFPRTTEMSKWPLHIEIHKPYEKLETDRGKRKIRTEEIIG